MRREINIVLFVLGPAQAHPRGSPGPRVLIGRSEGHQAIGREDQ